MHGSEDEIAVGADRVANGRGTVRGDAEREMKVLATSHYDKSVHASGELAEIARRLPVERDVCSAKIADDREGGTGRGPRRERCAT